MAPARPSTAGFRRTNNLLLRLIAGTYVLAFVSLALQILGLCGSRGIVPVGDILSHVASQEPGFSRYFAFPTIFWFGSGDAVLAGAAWLGAVCAAAAAAGFFPLAFFALCFVLYLSFYTTAGPFLHFQWDLLLLESGFLAIVAAPLHRYKNALEPSRAVPFLFRCLVFKLMFASGLCKWASGDQTWRTLTALNFHYETQPLPPWTAWYFDHAPDPFHRLSAGLMFAIELLLPFFIFAGRRGRLAAFGGFVFLQVMIFISGNYGFFNVLTLVLLVSLWDDGKAEGVPPFGASKVRRSAALAACVLIVPLSIYLTGSRWFERMPRAAWVDRFIVAPLQAWPLVGTYGLFSVMTTERREIVLEGSDDGENWKAYEFRWKPGEPSRRPAFATPHMPRLDWQMWFAALGSWRQNPWFMRFCQRLLEGSPAVTKLLAHDPFAGRPPKYVRALFYEYRFSSAAERQGGAWWERKFLGLYAPPVALREQR